MPRQRDLFEILSDHEVGLNMVQRALSRLGQYLPLAGGVLVGALNWANSFGNDAGQILAFDVTGRHLLRIIAEGGDAVIQMYGSSDSSVTDEIYFYATDGAGGSDNKLVIGDDVSILTHLLPNADITRNIGSATLSFNDVYAERFLDEGGSLVAPVLTDRTYTSSYVVTTTPAAVTACTIVIPTHWNTYDVELFYTCYLSDSSGGSIPVSNVFKGDWRNGSTSIGYYTLLEMSDSNIHDNHSFATNAFEEGLTATGSQTWNVYVDRTGAPTLNLFRGIGMARAIRTS